jgi:hypothetical protein
MPDAVNKRKAERRSLRWGGAVYDRDGRFLVACSLRNVSATGMQIELGREVTLPSHVICCMGADGRVRRPCELVWQFSVVAGVRFVDTFA